MGRGAKFITAAAMLSVAACGGEQGKLEIRSTKTPLAAGHRPVPFRIAEANGQFALGNVALALEGYRIALREDPNSVEAMMGIAASYDRMARFDLSRRHYEAALAVAPGDTRLLTAFAVSLDLQGQKTEAASVRAEVQQRLALARAAAAPQPAIVMAPTKPVEVARAEVRPLPAPKPLPAIGRSVTVALAPARPVAQAQPAKRVARAAVAVAQAPARPVPPTQPAKPVDRAAVAVAQAPARPVAPAQPAKPVTRAPVAVAPPSAPVVTKAQPAKPVAPVAVAVSLPPALPAAQPMPVKPVMQAVAAIPAATPQPAPRARPTAPVEPAVTLALRPVAPPAPAPVAVAEARPAPVAPARPVAPAPPKAPVETVVLALRPAAPVAKPAPAVSDGPRIERTSMQEVALITVAAPQWRALTVARTQRSATVRFVPLRQAALRLSGVRILNAARVNRLAARTRSYLVGRGWSPMVIGDAPSVRARSVIYYPPERRRTAQRLSAQFGFVIAQRPGTRQITVLLGRDAARMAALRAG